MIKIEDLHKSFENRDVLKALYMNVKKGSIYGLIGKNGAGKTTLIKHITGILKADKGLVTIEDAQVFENIEIKAKIGFIADEVFFPHICTLKDMAKFYSELYKNWSYEKYDFLREEFGIDEKKKLFRFSKGMKKQASFILSLSISPEYLIMDEPMDGLDPLVRKKINNFIIEEVAERNMTVLISSHNLRELEGICDHIGILSEGKIILEKDLEDLKSQIYKVQLAFEGNEKLPYQNLEILHKESQGAVEVLIVKENKEDLEAKIAVMKPLIFDILPLTLEEIFIYELGGKENEIEKIIS